MAKGKPQTHSAPRRRGRPPKHAAAAAPDPTLDMGENNPRVEVYRVLPRDLARFLLVTDPQRTTETHRYNTGDSGVDALLTDIFHTVQTFLANVETNLKHNPEFKDYPRRTVQDLLAAARNGESEPIAILRLLIRSTSGHLLQQTTAQINEQLGLDLFPVEEANELALKQANGRTGIADMLQADSLRDAALDRLVRWLLDAEIVDDVPLQSLATERAAEYPVYTTLEIDALSRATADGRTGVHWARDEQLRQMTWHMDGVNYRVSLRASQEEQLTGMSVDALERVVSQADADGAFVALYIMRLLTPKHSSVPSPVWIDVDDVAEKVGFQPDKCSAEDRAAIRARIFAYVRFLSRAIVTGERTSQYYDRHAKKNISTRIASPLFAVLGREIEVVPEGEEPPAPRQVELVLSSEWARILTHPNLAQYLPMGEMLGAIPPGKPSGAWARVIGLALASFWRRLPEQSLNQTIRPTREELLSRYAMAVASYRDILDSSNPRRAISYWAEALDILVEKQMLTPVGEAARGVALKGRGPDGEELPRKGWQRRWLETKVDLVPGPALGLYLKERADRKPLASRHGK